MFQCISISATLVGLNVSDWLDRNVVMQLSAPQLQLPQTPRTSQSCICMCMCVPVVCFQCAYGFSLRGFLDRASIHQSMCLLQDHAARAATAVADAAALRLERSAAHYTEDPVTGHWRFHLARGCSYKLRSAHFMSVISAVMVRYIFHSFRSLHFMKSSNHFIESCRRFIYPVSNLLEVPRSAERQICFCR